MAPFASAAGRVAAVATPLDLADLRSVRAFAAALRSSIVKVAPLAVPQLAPLCLLSARLAALG